MLQILARGMKAMQFYGFSDLEVPTPTTQDLDLDVSWGHWNASELGVEPLKDL